MIQITKQNPEYLVSLQNIKRLNVNVAECIKKETIHLIKNVKYDVVFDLGGIVFIDTKGFSTLLELKEHANKTGKNFLLTNVSEDVNELIRLMNLHDTLKTTEHSGQYAA